MIKIFPRSSYGFFFSVPYLKYHLHKQHQETTHGHTHYEAIPLSQKDTPAPQAQHTALLLYRVLLSFLPFVFLPDTLPSLFMIQLKALRFRNRYDYAIPLECLTDFAVSSIYNRHRKSHQDIDLTKTHYLTHSSDTTQKDFTGTTATASALYDMHLKRILFHIKAPKILRNRNMINNMPS